ncbi:hypothetical protein NC652_006411 [Populus alba x Populus x berolinensis]|nr:hypothetical protein NC652_006411 [Populus alba x Populus x berolinensis]
MNLMMTPFINMLILPGNRMEWSGGGIRKGNLGI